MRTCANCKTDSKPLSSCARCYGVSYCSVACQRQHWVAEHRARCPTLALKTFTSNVSEDISSLAEKRVKMLIETSWTVLEQGGLHCPIDILGDMHLTCLQNLCERNEASSMEHLCALLFRAAEYFSWPESRHDYLLIFSRWMFSQRQCLIDQSVDFVRRHVLRHVHRPDRRIVLLWMTIGGLCARSLEDVLRDGTGEEEYCNGLGEHIRELLDLAEQGVWCQHTSSLKLICDHLSRMRMFDPEVRLLRVASTRLPRDSEFMWEAPFYLADSLLWLRRLTEAEGVLTRFKSSCTGPRTHTRAFVDIKLAVIAWEREHDRDAINLVNKAMAMLDTCAYTYSINLCHLIKSACAPKEMDLLRGLRLTGMTEDHDDARQHIMDCMLTPPKRGGNEGFAAYMSLVYLDPNKEVSIMTSDHSWLQRPALQACLLSSALARDLGHLREDHLYGIMHMLDKTSLWSMRSMVTWTEVTRLLSEKLHSRGDLREAMALKARAADMEAKASSLLQELRRRCLKNRKGKKAARSMCPVQRIGDCVVCLLEVEKADDAMLPCMKQADDSLHRTCLEEWIDACRRKDVPPSCPHCRQDVFL